MKNLILTAVSAILLVSCSQDILLDTNNESIESLTFNVEIPTLDNIRTRDDSNSTKTFGDGSSVYQLRYYIYGVDNKLNDEPILSDDLAIVNSDNKRGASLNIQLPNDFDYEVVFLATACDQTNPDSKIYYNPTTRQLNVNYDKIASNDESVDCFYGVIEKVSSDNYNYNIILKRPFAQLNVGDKNVSQDIINAGVTVKGVYSSMNIMDGSLVGAPIDVTLSTTALPTDYSFPVSGIGYLTMNYLLVNEQKDVDVTLVTYDGTISNSIDFTKVPLKRNCQTNIYGNLFGVDNDFIIQINPDFDGSDVNELPDDPYQKYDIVLRTTDIDTESKLELYLKEEGSSNRQNRIDLLNYVDSQNMIKLTWSELGYVNPYCIGFSSNSTLKDVIKLDINKINVKSLQSLFESCKTLESVDAAREWDTSNIISLYRTFANCSNLTSLESIENWDTSNVSEISYLFSGCSGLTSLNLSNWNISKINSLERVFEKCSSLTSLESIENWDTSNVYKMGYLFSGCSNLQHLDLSKWDTSNLNYMNGIFNNCSNLTSLESIENWDTSNVHEMSSAFNGCSNLQYLDLSKWDTSNLCFMSYTFANCSNLTSLKSIENWDMTQVSLIDHAFQNCTNLTSLNLSKNNLIVNGIDIQYGFAGCSKLSSLNLSNCDMSGFKYFSNCFNGCYELGEIIGPISNIKKSIDLSDCPLTNQSAMYIINALVLLGTYESQSITFSESTKSTLTNDQITIATRNRWTVK